MTFRLPLAPLMARLLVLAAVLPLTACDEGVDPTVGTDAAFTLYGYLDPTADQQAIRVVPIADRLDPDAPEAIDAEVTVTDLASGEVVAFRDSLVTFEGGGVGHVFVADWTPTFGRTYELNARRTADGLTSSVEIDVPPPVDPTVGQAVSTLEDVIYPISFGPAPNVFASDIELLVTGDPRAPSPTDTTVLTVPFPEGRGSGGLIEVEFVTTVRQFLSDRGLNGQLTLIRAELVAFVANEIWDVPSGRFDDVEETVEPGTISNVTAGFGFVGGGYYTRTSWTPSVATAFRAGFSSEGDPASQIRINEISVVNGWVELYNPLTEIVSVGGYSLTDDLTNNPTRQTLPSTTSVPARGFLVVDLDFPLSETGSLSLTNGAGREVTLRNISPVETGYTFGSYPDGRTLVVRLGNDAQDLMGGALIPTRGAPNVPDVRPVVLNELFTAGSTGWAEVTPRDDPNAGLEEVRVRSTTREFLSAPSVSNPTGFVVFDEEPGKLELEQQGGEVYVLATYRRGPGGEGPTRYRVVDYREFRLQNVTQSEGRLPDVTGDWQGGLTPTRGAANASGRPLAGR